MNTLPDVPRSIWAANLAKNRRDYPRVYFSGLQATWQTLLSIWTKLQTTLLKYDGKKDISLSHSAAAINQNNGVMRWPDNKHPESETVDYNALDTNWRDNIDRGVQYRYQWQEILDTRADYQQMWDGHYYRIEKVNDCIKRTSQDLQHLQLCQILPWSKTTLIFRRWKLAKVSHECHRTCKSEWASPIYFHWKSKDPLPFISTAKS